MSRVTCHVSLVTCLMSHGICYMSPFTCHQQQQPLTLPLLTPPNMQSRMVHKNRTKNNPNFSYIKKIQKQKKRVLSLEF